ncbi:TPA: hypothetical protein VGT23_003341 [Vibrio cholerae]|nr:hypothetical protein [Vibrio cholerae]HEQ3579722.1 hypothetical protein [Vibrio cholerae]
MDDLVFIRPTSLNTERQILSTLLMNRCKSRVIMNVTYKNNRYYKIVAFFYILCIFIAKQFEEVCFGYVNSKVSKVYRFLFKKNRVIIYDDGVATLSFDIEKSIAFNKNLYFKTIFYSIFSSSTQILKNEVPNIKLPNYLVVNNAVCAESVFVGAKVVEVGILNQNIYLNIIKDSISRFNVQNYLAHRDEEDCYLDKVRSLGLNVIRNDMPIEVLFTAGGFKFNNIIGVVSTALITVKLIGSSNVFYYSVGTESINRKDAVIAVEDYFDRFGLTKVDFDE